MKKMSGKELAKDIGCGEEALTKSFTTYNDTADGKIKDPWGKKYYHNLPFNLDDTFHVALMVCPLRVDLFVNVSWKLIFRIRNLFSISQWAA